MRRKSRIFAATATLPGLGLTLLLLSAPLGLVRGSESWHVTPGVGMLLVPGGQPTRDGLVETLRLGYDLDAPVSIELGGLTGNLDNRDDAVDGRRSAIVGSWADAIVHLARWERFDPFLSAGVGALWSDHHTLPGGHQEGVAPRLGAGILYTLSEHWSAHIGATVMTMRLPDRHACFGILEAGLSYYFGDTTPAQP